MTNRSAELGDKLKCRITGFVGIATTHAKHLSGCDRFWVSPQIDADGKSREGQWLDIDMVEIIEPKVIEVVSYPTKAPGGADLPNSR